MANKTKVEEEPEEQTSTATGDDYLTGHRAGNYLELGFDVESAFGLAKAKDSKGFFIYHGSVKKMLDQGASHQQVVAIFL